MELARPSTAPVSLAELVRLLSARGVAARLDGDDGVVVTGVTLDSRSVRRGDLFAALPGAHWHGARFVGDAVASGAVAVITDPEGAARLLDRQDVRGLPVLVTDDPRAWLGELSARVYGNPADDLLVLGVTGTNGKTTTTWLLESGLRAAGHVTGLIGTIASRIGDEALVSDRTTPEAPDLHALLARMRDAGVTAVAMEVSSHALAFGRVDGLVVDVAGFTQLGRDHLDLHGSEEAYFAAKARLFTPQHAASAVITVDDDAGRRLSDATTVPHWRLRTTEDGEDAPAQVVHRSALPSGGYEVGLRVPGGDDTAGASISLGFVVSLPGTFNVSNAALAAAMLVRAGVDPAAVEQGIASAPAVPGRMEPVDEGQPFMAVVDYAHTPDALAAVLTALRPHARRLVVVFGCGGDRDRAKRPEMGGVATRLADVVVVTDDNPRSEQAAAIRGEVMRGVTAARNAMAAEDRPDVHDVGGRAEAIRLAVSLAREGDVVVVAGKGHETGQDVAGVVHPFDDRLALRQALRGGRVSTG